MYCDSLSDFKSLDATVKHRILSRLYYFGYATFVWVGRELGGRKCGWEGNWDQRRMQTMHSRARVRGMLHGCMPACMLLSLTASSKHVHFYLHTCSMHAHARPATAKVRDVFTHPSCPCWSVQSKPGGGALQAVQACQWCRAPAGVSVPPFGLLPPASIGLVRPLRGHGR